MKERISISLQRSARLLTLSPIVAIAALTGCGSDNETSTPPEPAPKPEVVAPGITTSYNDGVAVTAFDEKTDGYLYADTVIQFCQGSSLLTVSGGYRSGSAQVTPKFGACADGRLQDGELKKLPEEIPTTG